MLLCKPGWSWQTILPYVLIIGGVIGLLASFTLTYDKIHVLQDPHYQPGCNLNPVLSCGSVMKTKQASLLGVPNSIFGLIAFSMLAVFGVIVASGALLKRWLWLSAQGLATLGVIFMHYLFFQAAFRLHTICPWCFVVWMITIPIFFGVTIYNIRADNLGKGRLVRFVNKYSIDLLVLWYLIIFATLAVKFWYYWRTLL
ncbi:MAG TPA: vitamin K epoxide reductase family protein [Candidatus Saccharimonadales bacterium]|nr:vitamin K epoxide reductase family protein [Candidatus Saccharimonadales bacterium]